jgi:NADH-quinone oxidoreductase subunit L
MPALIYILAIPLLPLVTFLLLGIAGRNSFNKTGGYIGTLSMLVSTMLSLQLAYGYFFHWGKVNGTYQHFIPLKLTWLNFSEGLSIDLGILLDPIAVMMLVVVSFISLMVHIYSLGYMKGEERFGVYYAFLSLFTFSMLGLVLSSNIFQIYMFWELVGVSSFLLIGFYYQKSSAVAAAKKAFIVTRFADLGMLIGILIIAFQAKTLDFTILIERLGTPGSEWIANAAQAGFLGWPVISWGLILVFAGGAGKSAMFPLHIWLPDAMEGPTPVSALIHAATMVVAGVFLVARLFPVYTFSAPGVLEFITYIGVFSALFAAVIACTQTDIKRVLAYSTMSQIGFMMFALGVSGYGGEQGLGFTASQFHLFTHAIFKALLFLCAGVVIHHVHSNELNAMGGLRRHLPVTHISFLLACLAIAGIPPFAGFFSKEEILLAAYQKNRAVFALALFTSALTAFYMFRLYFKIFWFKPLSHHGEHKEGSASMLVPLCILALGAIVAGFIPFGNFVSSDGKELHGELHINFSIAPVLLGVAGIFAAAFIYKRERSGGESTSVIYMMAYRKFYIDEIYLFITKKIIFNGIGKPAAWFDKNIVDGMVNFSGILTEKIAGSIKKLQSGKVQQYTMLYLAGILVLALVMIYFFNLI